MKLIDKATVVAEIEKRKKRNLLNEGAFEEDVDILSFINAMEVKEVDLDKKEIIDKACWWLNNNRLGVIDDDYIKEFRKAINN